MVSAGSYILSVALLAALVCSLGFAAVLLRRRLLPEWEGAPARLVETIVAVALLVWLSELLGLFGLFYAWTLVGAAILVAVAAMVSGGADLGGSRTPPPAAPPQSRTASNLLALITLGVIAVVVAHWGLIAKDALDRGIFNFDSLWYHMPFAAEMAQSHSLTGIHYTDTIFTNWFYPQNSELLHAVGIVLTERDTLSLFLNFGWLAVAFLAAWCIGRPFGRGPHAVAAAAIVLECHTLIVRQPGAAKNDLMAAALLLAAIAILVTAWSLRRPSTQSGPRVGGGHLPVGWALAAAGLAVGLAAGAKVTALAMAAALSVAILVLAPAGRRRAAALWWFLPAFAAGGFWYLRNLVITGNPLPQVERIGPIPLPHPEVLQTGRPDFTVAHYATDTAIWSDYFGPGLEQAFGALWPLVVLGALAGALTAVWRGPSPVVRWGGGVVLVGFLAYVFTPLTASGLEGEPIGFSINIRFAIPALLAGLVLLPVAALRPLGRAEGGGGAGSGGNAASTGTAGRDVAGWVVLVALVLVVAATNRSDAVLRDPSRVFAWGLAILVVIVPALLLLARHRGASLRLVGGGFVALALVVAAVGYTVQRDYLEDRFGQGSEIPGLEMEPAYQWAQDIEDARIGLAGTTSGLLEYGFFGRDLSNRVVYLGRPTAHGGFVAIPDCAEFRAAVNEADLDYLVTAPFLNFLRTSEPVPSPEAGWLRGEDAVSPVVRSGPVTVWRVGGKLDPDACGPANEPLRRVPQTPSS